MTGVQRTGGLEFPISYAVLGVSGVIGGWAALVGLYKVLAHSRAWVAVLVIGLLLAPQPAMGRAEHLRTADIHGGDIND